MDKTIFIASNVEGRVLTYATNILADEDVCTRRRKIHEQSASAEAYKGLRTSKWSAEFLGLYSTP